MRGLEGAIGLPTADLRGAMEREHQSEASFVASNYGTKTSPKVHVLLPWREAGPPDHHDDIVDSDQ